MYGRWFIVANQRKMRVFTETPEKRQLKLIKSLDNPLAHEKRKDLVRKQAGMGVKSLGKVGCARYIETKRHDPIEEASLQFAREIVEFLTEEKRLKNFESLTIAAEPRFLGKIKVSMKPDLKKSVASWIRKDLQKMPQKDLRNYLDSTVGEESQ